MPERPPPPHLDDVQRAVVTGRQVRLGYVARDRSESTRIVHPLGIAAKGSIWYLVGDTEAGLRTFRVDRVREVEVLDDRRRPSRGLRAAGRLAADQRPRRRAALAGDRRDARRPPDRRPVAVELHHPRARRPAGGRRARRRRAPRPERRRPRRRARRLGCRSSRCSPRPSCAPASAPSPPSSPPCTPPLSRWRDRAYRTSRAHPHVRAHSLLRRGCWARVSGSRTVRAHPHVSRPRVAGVGSTGTPGGRRGSTTWGRSSSRTRAATSEQPLIGRTIGEDLRRTIARHGGREALVDCPSGRRWTYAAARRRRRPARPRAARGRHRGRRPGRDLGAELPGVGAAAVRHRRGRGDPRQHQPGVPHPRAGLRARPVRGASCSSRRRRSRRATTRRWSPRWRRSAPRSKRVVLIGTPDWDALVAGGDGVAPEALDERMAGLRLRRPDQHPVHVGHDRVPQGGDPVAPQHPQQRVLRRRAAALHRGRPGVPARALLPLLRHGDGQPRLHVARVVHRHPGARLRPGGDARGRRRGALHVALRRADDVHRHARRPVVRRRTTCPRCAPASWPARRARSR